MPLLRITKVYNAYSNGLAGIVEIDKVHFENKDDAAAWLMTVHSNPHVGFTIRDAEWVLVDLAQGAEVIENPTGGFTGKITDARQYGVR